MKNSSNNINPEANQIAEENQMADAIQTAEVKPTATAIQPAEANIKEKPPKPLVVQNLTPSQLLEWQAAIDRGESPSPDIFELASNESIDNASDTPGESEVNFIGTMAALSFHDHPDLSIIEGMSYEEAQAELDGRIYRGSLGAIITCVAIFDSFDWGNGALWRDLYAKHEDYCLARWGYRRSASFQMRKSGEFLRTVISLSGSSIKLPRSESQVLAILKCVPEEHRFDCWNYITRSMDPGRMSATQVEREALSYLDRNSIQPLNKGKKDRSLDSMFIRKVRDMQKLAEDMPDKAKIKSKLRELEALIDTGAAQEEAA